LRPASEGSNTLEAKTFSFVTAPPSLVALSQTFINGFHPNDQRKVHWTKSVTDGIDIWYHPYKYKIITSSGSSMEHSVVFRLAELFMIRAEARMRLNNFEGAMADLNKIR